MKDPKNIYLNLMLKNLFIKIEKPFLMPQERNVVCKQLNVHENVLQQTDFGVD